MLWKEVIELKRWGKGARWGIFVLVLAALIAMAFFYIQHQKQVADPKNNCSMLQSPDEVSQALANHEDLTHRFEGIGEGVEVSQTSACDGEKAIISISYVSDAEKDSIERLLADGPYYGSAVELVKKD